MNKHRKYLKNRTTWITYLIGGNTVNGRGRGMDNLQKLFRSKKRMQILTALSEGPMNLKGFEYITKSTSSNLVPLVNDLKTQKLIEKKGAKYKITPPGALLLDHILGCVNTSALLDRHKEYLSTHRFDGLPRQFLKEFHVFTDSVVIGSKVNPFEVLEQESRMFKSEKTRILGVSFIVSKEWSDLLAEVAREGVEISLITTGDVLKTICNGSYKTNTGEYLSLSNTSLFANDDIAAGFIVTKQAVLVTLLDKNNSLDFHRGIYSEDPEAVAWGKRLFDHYMKKAVSVDKEMLMELYMGQSQNTIHTKEDFDLPPETPCSLYTSGANSAVFKGFSKSSKAVILGSGIPTSFPL